MSFRFNPIDNAHVSSLHGNKMSGSAHDHGHDIVSLTPLDDYMKHLDDGDAEEGENDSMPMSSGGRMMPGAGMTDEQKFMMGMEKRNNMREQRAADKANRLKKRQEKKKKSKYESESDLDDDDNNKGSSSSDESDSDNERDGQPMEGEKYRMKPLQGKDMIVIEVAYSVASSAGSKFTDAPVHAKVFKNTVDKNQGDIQTVACSGVVSAVTIKRISAPDPAMAVSDLQADHKKKYLLLQPIFTSQAGVEKESMNVFLGDWDGTYGGENGTLFLRPKIDSVGDIFYTDAQLVKKGLMSLDEYARRICGAHHHHADGHHGRHHGHRHSDSVSESADEELAKADAAKHEAKDLHSAAEKLEENSTRARRRDFQTLMAELDEVGDMDFDSDDEDAADQEGTLSSAVNMDESANNPATKADLAEAQADLAAVTKLLEHTHKAHSHWDQSLLHTHDGGDYHYHSDSNSDLEWSEESDSDMDDDGGLASSSDDDDDEGRSKKAPRISRRLKNSKKYKFYLMMKAAREIISKDSSSVLTKVGDDVKITVQPRTWFAAKKQDISRLTRMVDNAKDRMAEVKAALEEKKELYESKKHLKGSKNAKALEKLKKVIEKAEESLAEKRRASEAANNALRTHMIEYNTENAKKLNWINIAALHNVCCKKVDRDLAVARFNAGTLAIRGYDSVKSIYWTQFTGWLDKEIEAFENRMKLSEAEKEEQTEKAIEADSAVSTTLNPSKTSPHQHQKSHQKSSMKPKRDHDPICVSDPLSALKLTFFPPSSTKEGMTTPGSKTWKANKFADGMKFTLGSENNMNLTVSYVFKPVRVHN